MTSLSDVLDSPENIYENCAVIASQGVAGTPVEDIDGMGHARWSAYYLNL